jgi:PBSX family phage portal protein
MQHAAGEKIMISEAPEVYTFEIDVSAPRDMEKMQFSDPLEQDASVFKEFTGLSQYTRRKINKAAATSRDAEDRFYASTGYGVFNLAEPPYSFDELATFYDNSPSNHAAIVAKVSNVVGLGYNFDVTQAAVEKIQSLESKDAANKAHRKVERTKIELTNWLDSLNPDETFQQILDKVATDYEVFGNGYFEVGRTVTGQIGYLGHIPAGTVRVRRKRDGFIQIVGQHVTFFKNFGTDTASPITNDPRPNEIIHVKKYSPRSSFYGVPDSVAAGTAIVGDSLAAQYNIKYFDNSATPRYIVTLTGGRLSKAAEDKLFKFLQSSLRGNPHRTLFIPLPNDANGNPIKFEMHRVDDQIMDGSWENYRERNKQDILLAHAVPLSRVGGGNDDGVANSLASDRMFKEQVVVPTQAIFEKAISKIVKEKTDLVIFNLNELTLTDELAKSQIDERYARNQILTINEIREGIGYPAHAEGDKFFEPKPQTSAEQNAQANGTRERDKQRTANNSDSTTTTSGRNPQGAGSKE